MILSIRTDKPLAEIGLFDGQTEVDHIKWEAHRELSAQIHLKIEELLNKNNLEYGDLEGIAVFEGPGSFTGLRIGLTVANSLAYGLKIPLAAARGNQWASQSVNDLLKGNGQSMGRPFYGQLPNTTKPKK